MKIRRTLATAVVAAVTTPVVLLSVTPASADAKPPVASPAQRQAAEDKPSIEELEKAAAEAQKAYDDAVAAQKVARAVVEAALSDDAPLTVAAKAAEKEAADAATAKENADQALVDAQAALAALPEAATPEEKAAAEQAVADAETAAVAAAAAKTAADEKAATARRVADDARVAAAREYSKAQKAVEEALKAKEAADKALADAKEEAEEGEDCVFESKLTTVVTGLPSKIVAGSTTDFSLRVTNGTDKTLDEVFPFVYFHATDKSGYNVIDDAFHLQWSTATSPTWKNVEEEGGYAGSVSPLKAGAHADVKLRLKVDATAPAGEGLAFVAGDYVNDDESCGGNDFTEYAFELLAAGTDAGDVDDAEPGKTTPQTPDNKPQGVTSTTPVNAGTLADTGSSSALPQLAAASGAAVAVGAGAVFVVRRRKAGSVA
ncbi:LAETG motif-containing sortase-dependent surface protein [Streptomyces sp. NPDC002133]|uniref:LAETG motif-containing sortase-dependent surface protein n=1 Tax=Streptomyces sp. NPDC002133 TaxID=3154409 RepID=UPI003328B5DB